MANSFIRTNFFGVYDMVIGKAFSEYATPYFTQFDALAAKKYPERMVGDAPSKIVFGSDMSDIFAKAAGKTIEQYAKEVDVTSKLHKIMKPFFFISTLDDPMFGPHVIPIGHCHDNILLGVLKHGGHCCSIEGGLFPTG